MAERYWFISYLWRKNSTGDNPTYLPMQCVTKEHPLRWLVRMNQGRDAQWEHIVMTFYKETSRENYEHANKARLLPPPEPDKRR
jgi:hypothetical protein